MDKKIDPDLFARLMQMSAPARNDLLEYMGQGPMAMPELPEPTSETSNRGGGAMGVARARD